MHSGSSVLWGCSASPLIRSPSPQLTIPLTSKKMKSMLLTSFFTCLVFFRSRWVWTFRVWLMFLSNHYRGLRHTFSKIYTKFDAVPLLDPSQIHIRSDAWIQITGCQKWTHTLNCVKFCQDSPPKYQRGVSNASKFSSPKNGQFPPHLVVGNGQHLWMANAALETK
jgi:hypothetical protein